MQRGRFETCCVARLVDLRRPDVIIAYHTSFNPLPRPSELVLSCFAKEGKTCHLMPNALDVRPLDVGKVLSIGWRSDGDIVADLYRHGTREHVLGLHAGRAKEPRTRKGATLQLPAEANAAAISKRAGAPC